MYIEDGHLGGYYARNSGYPHGDPLSYVPSVWDKALFELAPTSMLDIGCGEGHAAHWFQQNGVEDVLGIEGCDKAIETNLLDRSRLLHHDFTKGPPEITHRFDLGWSCEFVEHVEEEFVPNILAAFSKCTILMMTYATPGQGGYHHVNCKPAKYWISKLFSINMKLDQTLTDFLRRGAPDSYWDRTGLVFRKG
jgi:SAM-dependent methyltransferase